MSLQIFCFRSKLSVHEIKSPFSSQTSDVLNRQVFLDHLIVFGTRWTLSGADFSLKFHGLDSVYDIASYDPDAVPQRSNPAKQINISDEEDS